MKKRGFMVIIKEEEDKFNVMHIIFNKDLKKNMEKIAMS